MKLIEFGKKHSSEAVIAAGFFDCVHKGHGAVISQAAATAGRLGAECAVLTFRNDPSSLIGKKTKQLYTFEERLSALASLGVETVIFADFDKGFMSLNAKDFLDKLTSTVEVKAFVCGKDYSFGKNAEGDVKFLHEYFSDTATEIRTVEFLENEGIKISSRLIKNAVAEGDVEKANTMLSEPYFMLGNVVHAHKRGTGMGFPTANIIPSADKLALKEGVYATRLQLDGKVYSAGTNVGTKPTFADSAFSVESYILDFDGDIYGKTVKLSFYKRLRDISDFGSAEALGKQLEYDTLCIRKYFSDKTEDKYPRREQ